MSVRHFTRVFTTEVGQSPRRFVERSTATASIEGIAATDPERKTTGVL
jgi:AraC-like DNA-binding protein